MKTSKKMLAICLSLAMILSTTPLINVAAQSVAMTSSQTELIRSGCVSAKTKLQQLHASDALLRVNMGQIYESILTKLMEKFNSRLSSNNYDNSEFTAISNSYSYTLDNFRSDYITYEKQLSSTLSVDCSNQPASFYDAVLSARSKRDQVHSDVTKLNQYADKYELAVNQFEKNYQKTSTGEK
jgi:outer membrane murein-binding lipoprotein Lpp